MKHLLPLILALFSLSCFSQVQDESTVDDVYLLDWDESQMNEFFAFNQSDSCFTIQLVFHVVYVPQQSPFEMNTEIPKGQVLSQIRSTNQFLSNDSLYYDPEGVDSKIRVALATVDEDGNETDGIIYYNGAELFGQRYVDYGLNNRDSEGISVTELSTTLNWGENPQGVKYLNCYVVNRIDGSNGGGVQAYAYFPTSSVVYGNYNLFNTVGAKYFQNDYEGDFSQKTYTNEGKVFTHELLHNFGIFHTFQGNSCSESNCNLQGDRVCDTEPQTQGSGCSGSCGFVSKNMMDYLSEGCRTKITTGQASRARLVLLNSLSDYILCEDCKKSLNGDFNNDGFVNVIDVSMINQFFGLESSSPLFSELYDSNCDGLINIIDVSYYSQFYGNEYVQQYNQQENSYLNWNAQPISRPKQGLYIKQFKDGSRAIMFGVQ